MRPQKTQLEKQQQGIGQSLIGFAMEPGFTLKAMGSTDGF